MDIRHSENMKHHTNADSPKQRNDQYESPVLVFLPPNPLAAEGHTVHAYSSRIPANVYDQEPQCSSQMTTIKLGPTWKKE